MDKHAYSLEEGAEELGISLRKFAELVAKREVRSFRTGRRRLVSASALRDYIERQEQEEAA